MPNFCIENFNGKPLYSVEFHSHFQKIEGNNPNIRRIPISEDQAQLSIDILKSFLIPQ